jgi:hypothetical protein
MSDDHWWVSPTIAVLALVVGLFGASWQEDRKRRIKNRTAARALRADLRRIGGELGRDNGFGFVEGFAGRAVPPRIHEWVSPLVTDLADENDAILPALLILERDLTNFSTCADRCFAARKELAAAKKSLSDLNEVGPAAYGGVFTVALLEHENTVKSLIPVVELAHEIVRITHEKAWYDVTLIIEWLDPIANREVSPLPFGMNPSTWEWP